MVVLEVLQILHFVLPQRLGDLGLLNDIENELCLLLQSLALRNSLLTLRRKY